MYFGRPSEYLLMNSERIDIPGETPTLGQLLNRLRSRGGRWAYELDDSHVICTVDQKVLSPFDTLEGGNEVAICSRKSSFEI